MNKQRGNVPSLMVRPAKKRNFRDESPAVSASPVSSKEFAQELSAP
jgi:hypothetical protein